MGESKDGTTAADNDQPYVFGRKPNVLAPFPFTARQLGNLLVLRSKINNKDVEEAITWAFHRDNSDNMKMLPVAERKAIWDAWLIHAHEHPSEVEKWIVEMKQSWERKEQARRDRARFEQQHVEGTM